MIAAVGKVLVVVIGALAAALAVVGFAMQQTLTDPARFTAAMDQALTTPALQAELRGAVRTSVVDLAAELADASPVAAAIAARLDTAALAEQAAGVVDSDAFATAWSSWSDTIFTGLAAIAQGQPAPDVAVSGANLDLDVVALLRPLVSQSGGELLGQALSLLGQSPTVTVSTGVALQPLLVAAGWLAQWRWALLGVTAGAALLLLLGKHRLRWWAILAAASAGTSALTGLAVGVLRDHAVPGAQYPQLSLAIVRAVTDGWQPLLFTAAAGAAIAAGVFLLLSMLVRAFR